MSNFSAPTLRVAGAANGLNEIGRLGAGTGLVIALMAGCTSEPVADRDASPESRPAAVVDSAADGWFMRLPESPTSMLSEAGGGEVIPATVIALPDSLGSAHIADVAALGNGRLAVLFRDLKVAAVINARDEVELRFGRAGSGPGEFADPVAIESDNERFMVLDMDDARPLEVLDRDGRHQQTIRFPFPADWSLSYSREPRLGDDAPYQMGPEDLTRRISAAPGGFVAMVGDRRGARWTEDDSTSRRQRLSLFSLTAGSSAPIEVEPLSGQQQAASTSPITDPSGKPLREVVKRMVEPLFQARPLVAGNLEWVAMFDPTKESIVVRGASTTRDPILTIEWPRPGARVVSDSNRLDAARAAHRIAQRNNSGVEQLWLRSNDVQRYRILRVMEGLLAFSDSLSPVSAMFAGERCLWVAPVRPADYVDGTGTILLGIDVRSRQIGVPVRIAAPGSRVRDVDDHFAYTTRRDGDGEFILERVPLPRACAIPAP